MIRTLVGTNCNSLDDADYGGLQCNNNLRINHGIARGIPFSHSGLNLYTPNKELLKSPSESVKTLSKAFTAIPSSELHHR